MCVCRCIYTFMQKVILVRCSEVMIKCDSKQSNIDVHVLSL